MQTEHIAYTAFNRLRHVWYHAFGRKIINVISQHIKFPDAAPEVWLDQKPEWFEQSFPVEPRLDAIQVWQSEAGNTFEPFQSLKQCG